MQPIDQAKINALKALGLSEATIAELLDQIARVEKSADDAGVRYKGAVADAANQFEAALKAARITPRLHHSLWDVWADNPKLAHAYIAAMTARLKQASPADVIDVALARLRRAATERAATLGDQAIADAIDQLAQTLSSTAGGSATVTDSGRMSAQKSYDPTRDALQVALGSDQTKKGHER